MNIRDLDRFLYDNIYTGLSKYGINNVHIVSDSYTNTIKVPVISIGLLKNLDFPLELGKTVNSHYYYMLEIFARSKAERDDIITALSVYLDQCISGLSSGDMAIITEIKPIESYVPNPRISTSIVEKEYYYIDFDGYTGLGLAPHHIDYSHNDISVEIDFTCNSFVTSGLVSEYDYQFYNSSYDAYMDWRGPYSMTIIDNSDSLQVYDEQNVTHAKSAFLAINTNGFDSIQGVTNVNLYFYALASVYPYRGNIYLCDRPIVPIDIRHWTAARYLVSGNFEITGAGWYSFTIPDNLWTKINDDGYTIFRIDPNQYDDTCYVVAYESGVNNAYLDVLSTLRRVYHTTTLVDKFDDDNLEGFKLWLGRNGKVYWTRGFAGSVITAESDVNLSENTRHHLSVGSRYANTAYDVKMFLNGAQIGHKHENWFILPVHTDNPVYVATNQIDGVSTGWGDIDLYGMRITQSYIDEAPTKYGQYLGRNLATDIASWRCNEGAGNTTYDFDGYNDLVFSGGYEWTNYLSEELRTYNKSLSTASIRIKIEVAESR